MRFSRIHMQTFTAFKAKFRVGVACMHRMIYVLQFVLETVGFHPRPSDVVPCRYSGYGILDSFTAKPSERQEVFDEVIT